MRKKINEKKKDKIVIMCLPCRDASKYAGDGMVTKCTACRQDVFISFLYAKMADEKKAEIRCKDCMGELDGKFKIERPTGEYLEELRKQRPDFGEPEIRIAEQRMTEMIKQQQKEKRGKK